MNSSVIRWRRASASAAVLTAALVSMLFLAARSSAQLPQCNFGTRTRPVIGLPGDFAGRALRGGALDAALKANPNATARYSRLFHMTPRMVRLAFSRLHTSVLRHDIQLTVFERRAASSSETIGRRRLLIPARTPAYLFADNTVAILLPGGNPVQYATLDTDDERALTGARSAIVPIERGPVNESDPVSDRDNRDAFSEFLQDSTGGPEKSSMTEDVLAPFAIEALYRWVHGTRRDSGFSLVPVSIEAGGLAMGIHGNSGRYSPIVTDPGAIVLRPGPRGGKVGFGAGSGNESGMTDGPAGSGEIRGEAGVVPEPSPIVALALGASSMGILVCRRRRARLP